LAPIGFVLAVGYSIAYLIVALSNDATDWWWWFVPIYGTIKIFQESVGLGIFHIGGLVVLYLAGTLITLAES
jgi:hypothetical protein